MSRMQPMEDILRRAAGIRLAIFDVDGVLTDGGLVLLDNGDECKVFNVCDGQGLVMLRDSGIELSIITGRRSQVVQERMSALGMRHIYQGHEDKLEALEDLLEKLELSPEAVAYMGDDLPDLPVLRRVGLAVTVANADPLVQANVHWQSRHTGGHGAVREFAELLLRAQGKLDAIHERYLR